MRVSESSLHLEGAHLAGGNAFPRDDLNIVLHETHLGSPYLLGGLAPGTVAGTGS